MMERIICPMKDTRCIRDECGWWDFKNGKCIIYTAAKAIIKIVKKGGAV